MFPRLTPEEGFVPIFYFPQTMMLDERSVLVGHLPNVRSLSILVKSDQGMRDIIWGIFFVPQLGPRGFVFRDLVPPYFSKSA